MRTLYIDTSSSFLYSAIVEDNKILGEIKEEINVAWGKVYMDKNLEGIDINEQAARLKDILKEKDTNLQGNS